MIMKGLLKVFEIILDTAEKEYTDEKPLKSRLMALSVMFDNNEITQEEYDAEEKKILERLHEIRDYVKEHNDEEHEDTNNDEESDDEESDYEESDYEESDYEESDYEESDYEVRIRENES